MLRTLILLAAITTTLVAGFQWASRLRLFGLPAKEVAAQHWQARIGNTIVGAVIMGVLFNGFVMLDVPQPIQQMCVGLIIIAAVWLDGFLRRRRR